jgi:hypothetical protein
MRSIITGIIIVAVAGVNAIPVTSASAAYCRRVKVGEVSTFKERGGFLLGYKCKGAQATSGWVRTMNATGAAVPGEAGMECYRVEGSEPSGWTDSTCLTAAPPGTTGAYVKIPTAGKCEVVEEEKEEGSVFRFAQVLVLESRTFL